MSAHTAELSIADRSVAAKIGLTQLLSEARDKETDGQLTIQPSSIEDLLDKFTLWAGSLGALQAPSKKLSLDYRLQAAPDIREQICEYLENLQEAIQDLISIVVGDNPNRDIHEWSDDDDEPIGSDSSPSDEAQIILQVIAECLRSLFRMAVLIRQAGPEDRFKRAMQHTELAFPDMFDIEHVEQKHAKLGQHDSRWLAKRLGSAIAKRRQFIKYCRDHKSRLGVDSTEISTEVETRTERLSSKATMFLKTRYVDADLLQSRLEDADDAASLMTASTAFDSSTLQRLPRLKDLSPDGQVFECPICFTLQDFLREKAWKMHAFRDLKSYVCTSHDEKCRNELFEDRNSWFEHELHHHRSQYTCTLCGEGPVTSKSDLTSHITSAHGSFSPDQISMLLDTGRQVPALFSAEDCPFCDDWAEALRSREDPNGKSQVNGLLVSPSRFKKHVATHQEQLAIFSIPRSNEKIGSDGSEGTNPISRDISAQASDDDDYQRLLLAEPLEQQEEEADLEADFEADLDELSGPEPQPLTEATLELLGHGSKLPARSPSASSSGSTVSIEETYPKKGSTRIPKRLVHAQAISDLRYPYEEKGDLFILGKALGQENIDELLRLSESYLKSNTKPESGNAGEPSYASNYIAVPARETGLDKRDTKSIEDEIRQLQKELEKRRLNSSTSDVETTIIDIDPGRPPEEQVSGDEDNQVTSAEIDKPKRAREVRFSDSHSRPDSDPEQEKRKQMWTEITKDLVTREAIEELGYDFEETDQFFYVMEYLGYDDVLKIVELSDDMRGRKHHPSTQQDENVDITVEETVPQPHKARDANAGEKTVSQEFGLDDVGSQAATSEPSTRKLAMRRRSF
ncbi:hypothetical protein AK830_g8420 [Neonectria ditissima]|uniref:C2H2-type domain-containing protein n=1 Tax=Neonectria ditissima TaxID=78410 RepID=A0A0P7AKK2_9HYPO|nr:hypothetical protein AK830_g8420 [Neonectria ditissima]